MNNNINTQVYAQKVELLLRLMPIVMEEGVLAVHGGTAINLFLKDGADFKVIIWRKEVDQGIEQVTQKTAEVVQRIPQVSQKNYEVSQKNYEVSQKIEKLSQKAKKLSQKLSQETIESIFFAINNDAYISVKSIAEFCGCSSRTIIRYINLLADNNFLTHHGPDKGGFRTINWDKEL